LQTKTVIDSRASYELKLFVFVLIFVDNFTNSFPRPHWQWHRSGLVTGVAEAIMFFSKF